MYIFLHLEFTGWVVSFLATSMLKFEPQNLSVHAQ